MKSGIKQTLRFFVTIGLVIGLALFVKNNFSEFASLRITHFAPFIFILLLIVGSLVVQGELLSVALRPLNLRLRVGESTALACISRIGNYLSFGYLGLAVRGYYLKKRHKLNYASFSSSLIAVYVIFFGTSGVLGLISYFITVNALASDISLIVVALVVLFLAIIALLVPFRLRFKESSSYRASVNALLDSWEMIRSTPVVVLQIFLLSTLNTLIFAGLYYFEQRLFGIAAPFLPMILIAAVANINSIFSITPAGIGVNEGLSIIAANLVGVDPVIVVSGLLVRRVIVFFVSALLAVLMSKRYLSINATQLLRFKAKG